MKTTYREVPLVGVEISWMDWPKMESHFPESYWSEGYHFRISAELNDEQKFKMITEMGKKRKEERKRRQLWSIGLHFISFTNYTLTLSCHIQISSILHNHEWLPIAANITCIFFCCSKCKLLVSFVDSRCFMWGPKRVPYRSPTRLQLESTLWEANVT